ncbi:Na+/H+ antiporter NhaC family protein [Clostridium tertium]|jgi:Na+/H+ antiporter NhaC|uniref:Na+/H+ antiporter NhaC family protein n=1 Tax=Clostridium TaxID=1485 RepID=UPI000DD00206|nr:MULTISPECIES: Na+/H+ antiporter NhaC family protein [Clostridium]MBS5307144.1 Na+/H+ antiporter NhaC family protein [Clostridium sp.]MDB1923044.1 Na+/H+ antiporter NhaC family protein [Clostridium tertium]MDB1926197.1 Na+/H+ antiporter NhaC family protein [Clostridium tertium]MDB1930830.1 Na+/H+ antiporter NhaC family protein [Clostridium tertium]MDB1934231.1 Na+/H+ antiporter NhaC family protein [Clostridium tertium]
MNNKKSLKVLLMTIMMTLLSTSIVFAAEVDTATSNANHYGLLTLIPPVVAIVLAFLTKNVIISLFIGTLSGTFLVQLVDNSFLSAIVQSFLDFVSRALNSLADPWNAGIILQVLVIGGVIHLVAKMGGAKAVAEALARKAKTAKSTQVVTLLLGLAVFFDDYANSLIVGPIMKPVADKMKISRERLAFIIDATAAPIAGLAIVSTWIGLEVGLINDAFINGIGQEVDAFGVFLQTIPYRFYNILILVFVFITSILLKEFGPMYKAEVEARGRGLSFEEEEVASDSNMDHDDLEPKEGIKLSIWNAIIPIGVLVITALLCFYFSGYSAIMGGEDVALQGIMTNSPLSFKAIQEAFSASDASVALFQSALVASIVAIIMGVAKKIFTVSEAIDTWIDGMKPLLITGVILLLAWSLSSVIKDLGTAKYLVSLLSGSLPNFLLPSLIFILGAIISFATGTAYGTMGILMPLAIPLAYSMNPDMSYVIVSTSAVLTGAIFGDHCSPISDTTILSSMGAGCNHIAHVNTQMWYALFIAAITILFGYIPAGFGLQWYIVLPISIIAVFLGVQILGKKVEEAK